MEKNCGTTTALQSSEFVCAQVFECETATKRQILLTCAWCYIKKGVHINTSSYDGYRNQATTRLNQKE